MQISPRSPMATSFARVIQRAQRDDRARHGQADRAFPDRHVRVIAGRDRRGFGEAVALDEDDARIAFEISLQLDGKRRAAGNAGAQRFEIIRPEFGVVADRIEQRRHARHYGRPCGADQLHHHFHVEARHQDHLRGIGDGPVHDRRHGKNMEERQHRHDPLGALAEIGLISIGLLHIDRQVGVGEHRAFRRAGRAAGILQHGNVIVRIDADAGIFAVIGGELIECHELGALGRGGEVCELLALQQLEQHALDAGQNLRERADDRLLKRAGGKQRLDLRKQRGEIERRHDRRAAVLHLMT